MSDVLIINQDTELIEKIKNNLIENKLFERKNIYFFHATFKDRAWEGITRMPAETVIIPLHLTEEKEFDGLWLAEQIHESDLNILSIIITSKFLSLEKRQAIINITSFNNVHMPHVTETKNCLTGNCTCYYFK